MEKEPLYIVNIFVAGGDNRGNSSSSGGLDILYYREKFDFDNFRQYLKEVALSFIEGGTACAKDLHIFATILKISDIKEKPILKRVKIKLTTALKQ